MFLADLSFGLRVLLAYTFTSVRPLCFWDNIAPSHDALVSFSTMNSNGKSAYPNEGAVDKTVFSFLERILTLGSPIITKLRFCMFQVVLGKH